MTRRADRLPNSLRSMTMRAAIVLVCVIACSAGVFVSAAEETGPALSEAEVFFTSEVLPLLSSRCITCHGADKAEGGLRLDSREAAITGGDTGPAVVPGKPKKSLLLLAITGTHKTIEMPPKEKLAKKDVAAVQRWIRDGAPWPASIESINIATIVEDDDIGDAWSDPRNPIVQIFGGQRLDLWSLKPVRPPKLPATERSDWARQPIDQFTLARLENEGIEPPKEADARTLARRLYFDLTGLPPTPQQITEFVESVHERGADEAVGELVDELLASPRFGEHFARLWLDVVRYSDSNGFDWDEFRPFAWRFRDFVVRSFNADKPFDQFIHEQLAGDELLDGPPKTPAEQDCLTATGFLRLGPHDNAAPLFDEQDRSRAELLADVTETTASAFLGLTMSCCRCHDHKHDPISQVDHYRFRAFFASMQFADDLPLDLKADQEAIKSHNEPLDAKLKPLREKLAATPETDKPARDELDKQIKALEQQRRTFSHGLIMKDDAAKTAATHVLFQGDHKSPRAAVQAGFLTAFTPRSATIMKPQNAKSTGRRLTLANWIASPENPLTARVFVNRLWQSLMGRALVATPNDFGLAGATPEDAQLLDWLASEFVREGWSVKKLIRSVATSATYRQQSTYTAQRFPLRLARRLSAEQMRDSLLFVSGLLTDKADGPPVWPDLPPEALQSNPALLDDNPEKTKGWYPSPKPEQYCRSLFLVQKRNTRVPLMETFDQPENSTSCARREVSTVAPQALTLLNSSLAIEAAQAFAKRVSREAGDDPANQVQLAFEFAVQRRPGSDESADCEQLLNEGGLAALCRALLNLNEFVYVD